MTLAGAVPWSGTALASVPAPDAGSKGELNSDAKSIWKMSLSSWSVNVVCGGLFFVSSEACGAAAAEGGFLLSGV